MLVDLTVEAEPTEAISKATKAPNGAFFVTVLPFDTIRMICYTNALRRNYATRNTS